ncbi:MAG: CBS domain-containing protein [Anaerolineales bacterium]|nr:CBS domain-containing protein [Anaerolineales bacterium]MCB9126405.1 CBS domain-containing protein [Ardenticatenales bacterium]MCB9171566.1 CBS domain-containing protein [Ardenticatenales bacterium]
MQQNWYDRLQALRRDAEGRPQEAGHEALTLFEDWLFEQARDLGFPRDNAGMNTYIEYVASRGRLSNEQMARAQRFADIRNCLAHRSGLMMSSGLVHELLDFLTILFRSRALTAEQIMSRSPYTISPADSLRHARDYMLNHVVSQLPVLEGERVVGLLTNRDVLLAQSARPDEENHGTLTVQDAMAADRTERPRFIAPNAPFDEVLAKLQERPSSPLIVTRSGKGSQPILGIITISDLLPKL